MNVLRGWLLDNLGLKFTALLLAVVVYLNVYTDRPATMLVSFPLEFTDLPDSLTLSGPSPAMVQAVLKGTGKQLIGLRVKEPRLKISLMGAAIGHFSRALAASDLPLPQGGGVTVENLVGPRLIEIDLDERMHRDLPVSVRVEGRPAEGFAWLGGARVDPESVRVTGPRRAIEPLDTLRLVAVHVDGKRDTVRADVAPDSLPEWCTADPPLVRVRVALVRKPS